MVFAFVKLEQWYDYSAFYSALSEIIGFLAIQVNTYTAVTFCGIRDLTGWLNKI